MRDFMSIRRAVPGAQARRLGALILALGLLVALDPAPSQASVKSRLHDARGKLATLSSRLKKEEAQASILDSQLATIDQKIQQAVTRSAAIDAELNSVNGQIDDTQTKYDALRAQLDQMASDAFVQNPGGPLQTFLTAAVDSRSIGELTDRLEYASLVEQANVDLADQVASLDAQLSEQADRLNGLHHAQARLLGQLAAQRQQKNSAIASQQQLLASLDRSRTQIVALVAKLRKELKAQELAGIGETFQGNHNAPYGQWASLFLRYMGKPTCHNNMVVMVSWQVAEFTQAAWNPLATTHPMPGSTTFNGAGVQNYQSLAQGLAATKATIESGLTAYGYGRIVSALSSCSDPMVTARAIRASSWCAGCAGGEYVVNVVPKVEADYAVYASL